MTTTIMLAYASALLLAAATPGPSMFGVISTGLARGLPSALAVGLGIALGDVLLVSVALLGLVALAAAFGWIFAVIKYAGAAYLIFIGVKLWRAQPRVQPSGSPRRERLVRFAAMGLAMALGNPKAILFHASLMPLLLDLGGLTSRDVAAVIAIVFCVNMVVMTVYGLLSGRASLWFQTEARVRWINRFAGGAMAATGAVIALR